MCLIYIIILLIAIEEQLHHRMNRSKIRLRLCNFIKTLSYLKA